jgi:serine protease
MLVASMFLGLVPAAAFGADTASVGKINVSNLRAPGGYDRFIVTYRDGTRERTSASAATQAVSAALSRTSATSASLRAGQGMAAIQATYARKLATGADLVRTSRKLSRTDADALIRQIAADPAVRHVEADIIMRPGDDIRATAVSPFVPNDANYQRYQWHLRPADGTSEKIGSDTTSFANLGGSNVANAWNLADGEGVVVAVLDTGITQHPDLDTSLADAGYDFITDAFYSGRSTDGRVPGGWDPGDWTTEDKYLAANGGCIDPSQGDQQEDSSWHGTHVSGTVAELTNNGTGMAGTAYRARILPVRVLGHCGGLSSDIADAIVWAAGGHVDGVPDNSHPAQVINMSLGGRGTCAAGDVTADAIAMAVSRGTTVVVAAGNSGEDAANTSPANCPGVITVASNGITGKPAFYSNYGSVVTLSAPGGGGYANDASSGTLVAAGFAWSAINAGTTVPSTPTYGSMAGTSQATPEVAGAVALMISARAKAGLATLTPGQIKTYLARTARAFPQRPSQAYGAGILDTYAAVQRAMVVSDPTADAIALANGVPTKYQGDGTASEVLFKLVVPAKARGLTLRTLGGSGDVTLLVSKDTAPSVASAQYTSAHVGNNESVTINNAAPGTYYLLVTGITGGTTFSAMGLYTQ